MLGCAESENNPEFKIYFLIFATLSFLSALYFGALSTSKRMENSDRPAQVALFSTLVFIILIIAA